MGELLQQPEPRGELPYQDAGVHRAQGPARRLREAQVRGAGRLLQSEAQEMRQQAAQGRDPDRLPGVEAREQMGQLEAAEQQPVGAQALQQAAAGIRALLPRKAVQVDPGQQGAEAGVQPLHREASGAQRRCGAGSQERRVHGVRDRGLPDVGEKALLDSCEDLFVRILAGEQEQLHERLRQDQGVLLGVWVVGRGGAQCGHGAGGAVQVAGVRQPPAAQQPDQDQEGVGGVRALAGQHRGRTFLFPVGVQPGGAPKVVALVEQAGGDLRPQREVRELAGQLSHRLLGGEEFQQQQGQPRPGASRQHLFLRRQAQAADPALAYEQALAAACDFLPGAGQQRGGSEVRRRGGGRVRGEAGQRGGGTLCVQLPGRRDDHVQPGGVLEAAADRQGGFGA